MKKILKNKISIIGGGFSAFLAKILINQPCDLYTITDTLGFKNTTYNLTKAYKVGKILSREGGSYGTLAHNAKNISLHKFQKIGGNTNIWGGFINTKNIPISFIKLLKDRGIQIKKLSSGSTGSISNNNYIGQFQFNDGSIFNALKFLKPYKNYYLHSFSVLNSKIILNFSLPNSRSRKKRIVTDKVILSVGVVDLLDLLYRSSYLSDNDTIELTEFGYLGPSIKFRSLTSNFKNNTETIIRFDLVRAICHYLGIQKRIILSSLFKKIPFTVEQCFLNDIHKINLMIRDGNIIENHNRIKNKPINLGSSIHYCDLMINNKNINTFLNEIHPNLIGLGMAFVSQNNPGPISNDIIEDALKKLEDI